MPSKYDERFDVDKRKHEVVFTVDMSPSTLHEANANRGFTRTTQPVGDVEATGPFESIGSRGLTDLEAARRLGVDGQTK